MLYNFIVKKEITFKTIIIIWNTVQLINHPQGIHLFFTDKFLLCSFINMHIQLRVTKNNQFTKK